MAYHICTTHTEYSCDNARSAARVAISWMRAGQSPKCWAVGIYAEGEDVGKVGMTEVTGATVAALARNLARARRKYA